MANSAENDPRAAGTAKVPPVVMPERPSEIYLARGRRRLNWRRLIFILLGLTCFVIFTLSPPWPDAVDPSGKHFILTQQGKMALGLFLLAGVWWVFEVVPIGVTSIAIAVFQSLFLIRESRVAFTDFLDPSVWFIFASIVIGMTFSKTGLTQRIAYRMLSLIGENTRMIYLGAFVMTASLTLIMAHTAVAAAVFPLLMTIHALYDDSGRPTRFGKGLFIGMAYVAGAGSIITLLGAARGAVAIGFFNQMVGRNVSFFELSRYMFLPGALMVILLWLLMIVIYKPEKKSIPGLRQRALRLYQGLGPMKPSEIATLAIVFGVILVLSLRSFVPTLRTLDKSGIILVTTLFFFLFRVLDIKDLEAIPWNIILLFGGAMSIGFCLWQTGAAEWLAINWLTYLKDAPWIVFVLGITLFVLIMTNFIMNVAAIAISLPVALTMAPYLGVAPEAIFYASLAAAGMPFLLLVGAAPNAIAYESRQFRPAEFFLSGIPASLLLMTVVALFVWKIWPWMGMPVLLAR